jgi:hypothetical protein
VGKGSIIEEKHMRTELPLAALATVVATAVSLTTPGPALAATQVSCTVQQRSCETPPISTTGSGTLHITTQGAPVSWYLTVRDVVTGSVSHQRLSGNANVWMGGADSTYTGEMQCPSSCPGARLYVTTS